MKPTIARCVQRFMGYFGTLVAERHCGDLRMLEKHHGPSDRLPAHSHETPYLSIVLGGEYREMRRGETVRFAPGFAAVHAAGEEHEDRFVEAADLLILEIPKRDAFLGAYTESRVMNGPHVARFSRILRREIRRGDDLSGLVIEGLLYELAALLLRSARAGGSRLTEQADRLIAERFGESIGLSVIAEALEIDPAQLSRRFHQELGCTIGERIRARRIEHVCGRLRSKLPLSEIALEAGFADQSHMTRVFRQWMGVTPAAYRRALEG